MFLAQDYLYSVSVKTLNIVHCMPDAGRQLRHTGTSAAKALPHADMSATATAAVAANQLTTDHSPLQVRLSPCQFCSPVGISCLLRHLRVIVALVYPQDLVPCRPVPTKLRTDRASKKPMLVGVHRGGLMEADLSAGSLGVMQPATHTCPCCQGPHVVQRHAPLPRCACH